MLRLLKQGLHPPSCKTDALQPPFDPDARFCLSFQDAQLAAICMNLQRKEVLRCKSCQGRPWEPFNKLEALGLSVLPGLWGGARKP